ncbi:MAG: GNAT family N-acetyltransferase [Lachnospiraceae bacterium]|nr:GNAT family N-acetyltransferase [Lachnospiraceae bacterium]
MQGSEFSMPDVVESRRLALYPMGEEALWELLEEGQDFFPESVLSPVIRRALRSKLSKMKKLPKEIHPWYTYWRIVKKSGENIGIIGSKGLPGEDGMVELGYAMAREFRRKGYMSEALLAFLDWLYECPFCTGARLRILPSNFPSLKTARSCGFIQAGQEDIYLIYLYHF